MAGEGKHLSCEGNLTCKHLEWTSAEPSDGLEQCADASGRVLGEVELEEQEGRQGRAPGSGEVMIWSLTSAWLAFPADLSASVPWDRGSHLVPTTVGLPGWVGLVDSEPHAEFRSLAPWQDASYQGWLPGGGAVGLWWQCFSERGMLSLSSQERSLGSFFHCCPEKVFGSDGPRLGSHLHHLLCDFGQMARSFSNLAPRL